MFKKINLHWIVWALLAASLLLGACTSPASTEAPAAPAETAAPEEPALSEPVTLRLAVLPILETVPMYVAEEQGLFESHGVNVEFITVASAPERDQLITAGQADGMINEAVSTIFYNKEEVRVQIVRYARAATSETALFSILASKDSGLSTVEDLKGVEIGISQGTVIEYLNDRLLQAEGFSNDEIVSVAIPKIPDRLALLGTGELKAGILPEPATSMAILQGSSVILDDSSHPEYSFSTISFRKAVIDEHPQAIHAFLAALEEAVQMINADPARWKPLLGEKQLVPPPLMETFQVPQFTPAGVPTQQQWDDAVAWTKETGLMDSDVAYESSVNASFLP